MLYGFPESDGAGAPDDPTEPDDGLALPED
jgi:hypothetical protein